METSPLLNILFLIALALLGLVSIGILYLSTVRWRDRRRQERDKRGGV